MVLAVVVVLVYEGHVKDMLVRCMLIHVCIFFVMKTPSATFFVLHLLLKFNTTLFYILFVMKTPNATSKHLIYVQCCIFLFLVQFQHLLVYVE